jgi:ketosteroid isomerase-like protein
MRIKTLVLLATLAPAFAACGGEEPPPPQAPPPPPVASTPPPPASTAETPPPPPKPALADLIGATMKSIGEAFNAHDAQKFAAAFTADAVTSDVGFPEAHGHDEIAKSIQGFFDACSDAKGMPAHVWGKGNTVATDLVVTGTMTGDFMGMKASKKPIGRHQLIISTFNDDGLISSERIYGDGPGMMAQMKGAKDAPPVPDMPATTEMHWAKNTPDEDKLVDWEKTFNDAFSSGDAKAVSALIAADGDVTFEMLGGKTVKAGKELDKFNGDMFKAIPKAHYAVANAWAADGFLIAERTVTGTMKGRLGPLPPTNKEVTIHLADVIQPSADGKLQHGWVFANMAELLPQKPMKDASKEAPKDAKAGKDKAAAPAATPATK